MDPLQELARIRLAREKEEADAWHQGQLEAEDMREFILDGGLWLLRDDDARDLTIALIAREMRK